VVVFGCLFSPHRGRRKRYHGGAMTHDAFGTTGLLTPPTKPAPACELLFEFRIGHGTIACELRYHDDYGVEAWFVESDGRVGLHRRFPTRALAVEWAEDQQRAMERQSDQT
jgi:hypothetical protein